MTPERDWRKQLTRQRMKISRQRRAVEQSLKDQHVLIRAALAAGLGPTKIAKYSGLHISRISQIGHDHDS